MPDRVLLKSTQDWAVQLQLGLKVVAVTAETAPFDHNHHCTSHFSSPHFAEK